MKWQEGTRESSRYWDSWEREALAKGVAADLAQLGREIMRDHAEHGLDDASLGDEADAELMLAMCREAPIHSELRFLGDLHARSGAQEDGEVVARRSLAQRLGSTAELDRLLDSEATRWEALWAVRAGTQSERS